MNAFHLNVMLMPSAPTSLAHSSVGVLMVMLEMAGPVLVSKQTKFCLKSGYGEIMILTFVSTEALYVKRTLKGDYYRVVACINMF